MWSLSGITLLFLVSYVRGIVVPARTYTCVNSTCQLNARSVRNGLAQGICLTTCGEGNIWPKPSGAVSVSSEFTHFNYESILFVKNDKVSLLNVMAENFLHSVDKLIVASKGRHPPQRSNSKVSIQFDIKDPSVVAADYGNDESYTVGISTDSAQLVQVTISAVTVFGARHGLETLSQLISYDFLVHSLVIPSTVSITDKPAFPYRGVMIDISRNFISVSKVKESIRAMGYNKMNVLHFHLSDTSSFPVQLSSQPNLTSYGAYDDTRVLTTSDIVELTTYATSYGVMMLPEIDTPAHVAMGWQWGAAAQLGDLALCTDTEGRAGSSWTSDSLGPPSGHLNIANENVYPILSDVYTELVGLFGSSYFHMGGDEVMVGSDETWAACWNSSTHGKPIVDKVAELGLDRSDRQSFYTLWSDFTKRITGLIQTAYGALSKIAAAAQKEKQQPELRKLHIWGGSGLDPDGVTYNMMYQADVTTTLPPDLYTIQVWDTSSGSLTAELINKGYDVVLSNSDYVYLDCGNQGWVGGGGYWCQPYHEWYHIYEYIADVTALWNLTSSQLSKVKGSETLMWSEMADDVNYSQKVWPRSSALAEALWTNPTEGWYPAAARFLQWRDLLVLRGVEAEALQPHWCNQRDAYACFVPGGTPQ